MLRQRTPSGASRAGVRKPRRRAENPRQLTEKDRGHVGLTAEVLGEARTFIAELDKGT